MDSPKAETREKSDPKPKPPDRKPDTAKNPPASQKGKVPVSTTLVRRPSKGGSKTKLSDEEIMRALSKGAKIGKPSLSDDQIRAALDSQQRYGNGPAMTPDMVYMDIMRQTLYRAWDQPTDIGIAGLVTRVELSMDPDGTIASSRITAGSGNRIMDDSVMRAVRAVRRISRVPPEFFRSHRRIVVAFELTGNG